MKLVLATHNRGKVRELQAMFIDMNSPGDAAGTVSIFDSDVNRTKRPPQLAQGGCTGPNNQNVIDVLSLDDVPDAPEVVEDGETYHENAVKKATALAEHTGYFALADDSGLEADALRGAPGIHSARYAGEHASDSARINKLLDALKDVPDSQRTARFKCAIAIAAPTGQTQVVVGVCEGKLIHSPRGQQGFGYDPIFVPAGFDKTFAELGVDVKNRISHRAKALEKLKKRLQMCISKP
ncbi:MAG: RdgB/HAM1 family non-canonical purine NTP pyrophosphatase [Candidatus Poribacteria bacterium]|nr:RdgB/HAM1 family non-canonical purine NTP pyrophosphatase [Candidatus Poribacteria bacterium]